MESIALCVLQFWFSLLIVIDAVAVPGGGEKKPKLTKNHYIGSAKIQVSEKCDLMCPGQPPLSLPPNFFQHCAPSSSASVNISTPTTERSTTTTESSEEESSESEETETKKSNNKIGKHQRLHNKLPIIRRNHTHNYRRQLKSHRKYKIKKETVIFKREAKNRLFKHHKQLKERWRLDGCYVICSDGHEGSTGNGVNQGSDIPSYGDSTSDESDADDNYVEGEDTPIQIIYIPGERRPYETYQVNNYEPEFPPIPPIDFGYDPLFIEGKQKGIKRRRVYNKEKEKKAMEKKRGQPNKHTQTY